MGDVENPVIVIVVVMGILRTIPNMTIIMPADYYSARKLVRKAAHFNGPVYLRFTRDPIPYIYDKHQEFEIGKANELKAGTDISIIVNGDIMSIALKAAEGLEEKGLSVRLLYVYERTENHEIIERIGDAEIVFTDKAPITEEPLNACPEVSCLPVRFCSAVEYLPSCTGPYEFSCGWAVVRIQRLVLLEFPFSGACRKDYGYNRFRSHRTGGGMHS